MPAKKKPTDRERLQDFLQRHICEVKFTKKDRSLRTLRCTLIDTLLPPMSGPGSDKVPNLDVLPVFDLDAHAWKSFRVASLKSINTVSEFTPYEKANLTEDEMLDEVLKLKAD